MKKLLIATTNQGKLREFNQLFKEFSLEIMSLQDFPTAPDVEETGTTFSENARLKAETLAALTQLPTLADDSGLMVDALEGAPGVYSARYAGEAKNDQANIEKVLHEMKDVPDEARTASFVCVLALAIPGKATRYLEGKLPGVITKEPIGDHGFGYDPIFYVPDLNNTLAELSSEQKNAISHRAKAMEHLRAMWQEIERDLK
ncbi:MAG TPA: XTP/dITP diphosphatase [Candidatus Angelobacter sp.]|nr:XTP/dITP diphosphatase [Candidatus Angelobacter sp.]